MTAPRPESALMSVGRKADYDLHQVRPVDALALVLGYVLLLSMSVAGLISLFDWIGGHEQTVLPQIAALLARFD